MNIAAKEFSVSVIIPTKDRKKDLFDCLESVFNQDCLPEEVVVVDGGQINPADDVVARFAGIKYLSCSESTGLTWSKNAGIKASAGDVLIFLDDDMILEKDFISGILKVFEDYKMKNVGGVCGNMTNIDRSNLRIGGVYNFARRIFLLAMYGDGKFRISGMPTYVYGSDKIEKVEFLPGGITAYRREVFKNNMFDEKMIGSCYGEDADFSYRVSRKYSNFYTPHARAFHRISSKTRKSPKVLLSNASLVWYRNIKNLGFIKAPFIIVSLLGLFMEYLFQRDSL